MHELEQNILTILQEEFLFGPESDVGDEAVKSIMKLFMERENHNQRSAMKEIASLKRKHREDLRSASNIGAESIKPGEPNETPRP